MKNMDALILVYFNEMQNKHNPWYSMLKEIKIAFNNRNGISVVHPYYKIKVVASRMQQGLSLLLFNV